MPELGFFQWIIGGVVAGGLALFMYLKGQIAMVDTKANEAIDKTKDNQLKNAELHLHVAQNYSTKEEVKSIQQQTNHSLERLYEKMEQGFTEVRNDIKNTIAKPRG